MKSLSSLARAALACASVLGASCGEELDGLEPEAPAPQSQTRGGTVESDAATKRRPNVLLILADDLGWADLSVHGSRFHRTPNIDALAARGVRFSQAYSASPLCSPTRASILTGRDPARHGVTAPMGHLPEDLLTRELPPRAWPDQRVRTPRTANRIAFEQTTLAEAFRAGGYATALFGKWHLGRGEHAPDAHGFEHVVGGGPHAGPPSFFAPFGIERLPAHEEGAYLTDVLVDGAVDWLSTPREAPFFACLWFYQVHAPFQARADLRAEALSRLDPDDPQRAPTYAAMVRSLDDGVGRVVEALERAGLSEDTLVVFASDNGGNQYDTLYGELPDAPSVGVPPTRNLPFRGGKGTTFEGGVRVPLVFAWPGATAEGRLAAGRVTEALATSTDLYPTLLELAGLPPRPRQALDGVSLVPALEGDGQPRTEVPVFFPHDFPISGCRASAGLRRGSHKLLRWFGAGPGGADLERLFDLRAGEAVDLAEEEADLRADLSQRLDAYLERTGAVLPAPNADFDPSTERWTGAVGTNAVWRETPVGVVTELEASEQPRVLVTPFVPAVYGALTLEAEVAGVRAGIAELYWAAQGARAFSAGDRTTADLAGPEGWRTVRWRFDAPRSLGALRLQLPSGAEPLRLRGLRLLNASGDELRRWRPEP